MALLRKTSSCHLYTNTHESSCVKKVDLTKKYTVCNHAEDIHLSTDDWNEADEMYCKWSGEERLKII